MHIEGEIAKHDDVVETLLNLIEMNPRHCQSEIYCERVSFGTLEPRAARMCMTAQGDEATLLLMEKQNRENRLSDYIVGLIFDGGLLYVANSLPSWGLPVVLPSYGQILWAVNMSLAAQLGFNIALIFFHPLYLHHLGKAVMSALSAVALAVTAALFPFDLTRVAPLSALPWVNLAVRFALFAGAFGGALSAVVNLVRFFVRVFRGEVGV